MEEENCPVGRQGIGYGGDRECGGREGWIWGCGIGELGLLRAKEGVGVDEIGTEGFVIGSCDIQV